MEMGVYLSSFGLMILVMVVYIIMGCRKPVTDAPIRQRNNDGDYVLMHDGYIAFGDRLVFS